MLSDPVPLPLLEPILRWLADSAAVRVLGATIVPNILLQTVHLLALSLLLGTAILANLAAARLLFRQAAPGLVARDLRLPGALALAAAVGSGLLMAAPDAGRYSENPLFGAKMQLLAAALCVSALAWWLTALAPNGRAVRAAAAASLLLWTAVAAAGRGIGVF
jgi:hypothetical protein